jgi:hypothetical protein
VYTLMRSAPASPASAFCSTPGYESAPRDEDQGASSGLEPRTEGRHSLRGGAKCHVTHRLFLSFPFEIGKSCIEYLHMVDFDLPSNLECARTICLCTKPLPRR